jgi:hypothetical protein
LKNLNRNTRTIFIAYYKGKKYQTIGTRKVKVDVWETPIEIKLSLSMPSGQYSQELFGTTEMYDLIGITTNTNLKIDERTKVWVKNLPNAGLDNNDYVVKIIKKSFSNLVIGLSRRITSFEDIWLSNNNEQPFEVRLNVEKLNNGTLSVIITKDENITISSTTKFWFEVEYNESLDNNNYVLEENNITLYNDFIKYILTPVVEETEGD